MPQVHVAGTGSIKIAIEYRSSSSSCLRLPKCSNIYNMQTKKQNKSETTRDGKAIMVTDNETSRSSWHKCRHIIVGVALLAKQNFELHNRTVHGADDDQQDCDEKQTNKQ